MRQGFFQLMVAVLCGLVLAPLNAAAQRGGWDEERGRRGGPGWDRPGQAGLWDKLGTQSVGFQVDQDVIRVGRHEGRFEALKLRIAGNDIHLISARVVFANGETADLRVSGLYRAGSETPAERLDHHRARAIEQVQLVYRSNPRFRGEALVELWGLHADARMAPPRHESPYAPPLVSRGGPPWEMLGERRVDMKVERDVVPVGRWEGSFTKIRLKVLNHDIELRDVTIVYGNGETDQWIIRRRVRDEEPGPVFDLTGHRRVVERVIMTYRATNPFSQTTVQVWGGR